MKKVFLVFETDCNHTKTSRILIGIFNTKAEGIEAITPELVKASNNEFEDLFYNSGKEMLEDAIRGLNEGNQTQEFATNYIIEGYETGKLF